MSIPRIAAVTKQSKRYSAFPYLHSQLAFLRHQRVADTAEHSRVRGRGHHAAISAGSRERNSGRCCRDDNTARRGRGRESGRAAGDRDDPWNGALRQDRAHEHGTRGCHHAGTASADGRGHHQPGVVQAASVIQLPPGPECGEGAGRSLCLAAWRGARVHAGARQRQATQRVGAAHRHRSVAGRAGRGSQHHSVQCGRAHRGSSRRRGCTVRLGRHCRRHQHRAEEQCARWRCRGSLWRLWRRRWPYLSTRRHERPAAWRRRVRELQRRSALQPQRRSKRSRLAPAVSERRSAQRHVRQEVRPVGPIPAR